MNEHFNAITVELTKLELRRGDVLLVTLPKDSPNAHADMVKRELEKFFAGTFMRLMVVTADIKFSVARPPPDADDGGG